MDKTRNFFAQLFGQITWQQPRWLLSSRQKFKPAVAAGLIAGLVILCTAAYYGYHWYSTLPKPVLITATLVPPPITPLEEEPKPQPLTITFSANVAPINLIYKEVNQGVNLSPTLAGRWEWTSGDTLLFTPKTAWAAGQNYTVTFDKSLFAEHTQLARWDHTFSTPPFIANISDFRFYQDPTNPKIKQAVASINFNYPVDTKNLADYISLRLQALKNDQLDLAAKTYHYSISYDQYKRTAYLRSEPLTIDQVARYLLLTVSKGIPPLNGNPSVKEIAQTLLIPDQGSFFKITTTDTRIVRDQNNKPEQVLVIESTVGITTADLQKALHVYQLPAKKQPEKSEESTNWNTPGEVTADILATAKPLTLDAIPTDQDYATLHSFKFKADGKSQLYLKLDKGIPGYGGFKLNQDYITLVQTPEFPKEITFLHPGALMALSSEKKLSILIRGIPAVKFEFARIFPDAINHLVSQTKGKFESPKFVNYHFNQDNISQIFSEIQQLNSVDPGQVQYTALDFNKYLAKEAAAQQHGLFLLTAVDWDINNKAPGNIESKRLVLITDMGLLVKDNGDNSHDVFVQSVTLGTPVANVKVDILGKNGLPILTRTTDASGHVTFPTLEDFKDDREPTVYVAHKNGDLTFIPYNSSDRQLNYSRFDTGGVNTTNQDSNLTAYLFTDRGIYRPGDPIHTGIIVKQLFLKPQPAGLPLEAIITDPRGTTVLDQKISLPESGYFTLDYQPAATATTGQYSINLFIVKDGRTGSLLGSTNVQVHEFLPDRMKITTQFSSTQPQGWISPEGLKANVHLQNLFGTSAENRRVTGKIELTPQVLQFDHFKDYVFVDPLIDPKKPPKTFTENLPDRRTDAQGNTEFDLNLARFDKATYQLTFFAEGFEPAGGRSVSSQITQLVTPLNYLIGYKPDSDLSYIKNNSTHQVRFVAINSQLQLTQVENLRISLFEQRNITTLIKKPDGTYEYQSQPQEVPLTSTPFKITSAGTDYQLPTNKIGDFVLRVLDSSGKTISKIDFSVIGEQQHPIPKQAELSVKLNKTEYLPGEEIEMQITAPYTGAGLISLERDKVYTYSWFKADNTNSIQKIRIPEDFRGNGYLTITLVRAWNSNEIFLSPLSYTVVPFTVSHQDQTIKINLQTPPHTKPGEKLSINYSTDSPSKIIVYAVDEGILQVTDYQTPDPLKYFFRKNALEVTTRQIVDEILPNYLQSRELSAIGGDGGEEMLVKNLNPFKRKTDLPVVYWSGIIDASPTPQEVDYTVPDYFNGALRIMAVAVANNSAGSAAQKTLVSGDFVINPNAPTFIAPGDEFDVSVGVTNNVAGSGEKATVQLALTPLSQLTVIGPTQQSLVIPEGHERSANFKLRAGDQLGSIQLDFTASLGNKISHMHTTLSLRPASPFKTTLISGYTAGKSNAVNVNPDFYPQYRSLTAELSVSPLILAKGLQRYLENCPFLCTEQLTSKGFAILAMNDSTVFAIDKNEVVAKFNDVIQMLRERELSSGAFSYWPGNSDNSFSASFATVYALHFLTEVKARGYTIPEDLLTNGISYLQNLVTQDPTDINSARLQAYAIYVLTRNEVVTTNYITNLQLYLQKNYPDTWRQDIAAVYLAASYQMLKNTDEAQRLIAEYRLKTYQPGDNSFYSSLGDNAQYLTILAQQFPERLQKLSGQVLLPLTQAIADNSFNTLSAAYSTLALSAYSHAFDSITAIPLSLSEILTDKQVRELASTNNIYLTTNFNADAKQLNFSATTDKGYFYQITQAGFAKSLPNKVIKNGLEVYREYRPINGSSLQPVTLGSEIEVHLRIRSLSDRYLDNIALVDLLPGGFEVVRDSLPQEGIDYADIREDRVIFFTSASADNREIVYRIKAVSPGTYTVPPIFATSMYDPGVQANGIADKITVQ